MLAQVGMVAGQPRSLTTFDNQRRFIVIEQNILHMHLVIGAVYGV